MSESCAVCGRTATHRGHAWNGPEVFTCRAHRALSAAANTQRTAVWDQRRRAARAANADEKKLFPIGDVTDR